MLAEKGDRPNAVVGNKIHQELFANHLRRFAAQYIHPHGRLDIAKKQFDVPAFKVQSGQLFGRISLSIKQNGHNVKAYCSEPRTVHRDLDLPQGQVFRKLLPLFSRIRQRLLIIGAFPRHQQIIRPQPLETVRGTDRHSAGQRNNAVDTPLA